jgi:Actinobacteria/chloroflexi VLRF1 release factor
VKSRPAAGGGRWVLVDPARLDGWLARLVERHGAGSVSVGPTEVVVELADGSVATCEVPFPPLVEDPADAYGGLVAHAAVERTVGVLLFRLGGHAAGVFEGARLVASKAGSRQVHGRSSAGGWSQQRFARRREGQVAVASAAAADAAAAVLMPWLGRLDAVVLGGDRGAVTGLLDDPRLRVLRPLVVEPVLDVPDPRLRVLEQTPKQFRAVRVRLVEATGPATS